MKAIVLEKNGGIENFSTKEVEQPTAKDNEVVVAVKSISVNPVDYKVRAIEAVQEMICGQKGPIVLGWDIAGEVISKGSNVTKFDLGDKVFGMVNFPGVANAYAEQITSPEDHLAKIPESTSYPEAAATTLAALTALQALKNNVSSGNKVLIHAGSGGVGHYAIQIAKNIGAHVATTCSAKNRDFVLSIGADQHIDYRTEAFEEVTSDLDFILDGTGNEEILLNSIKACREGGKIISLPSPEFSDAVKSAAEAKNIDLSFILVSSNGNDMNELSQLLADNVIKPHVSKTFDFANMGDAHSALETGRTVGKVIVNV